MALGKRQLSRYRHHPMHAWAVLSNPPKKAPPQKGQPKQPIAGVELTAWFEKRSRELLAARRRPVKVHETAADDVVFADFRDSADLDDWFVDGSGLGDRSSSESPHVIPGPHKRAFVRFRDGAWADSARLSLLFDATLHSPTFTIEKRYVHVLAAGRASRINCVIDGFNLIRNPIYGGLKKRLDSTIPRWHTFDLAMWKGRPAYYHNPSFTLIRTSRKEQLEIARTMARKLNGAKGPVGVAIPTQGISIPNVPDGEFWDPETDRLFREELKKGLDGKIKVVEVDSHINDEKFTSAVLDLFFETVDSK